MKISQLSSFYISRILNRRNIYKRIYFERNHDINNTILVEGTGRSGTTWLAEMLADILHYRLIFEPFHPREVEFFRMFVYKEYIPPNYINNTYFRIFERILSGRVKNKWIDQDNQIFMPKGRIIKSIRASWFLKWLKNNFPMIPIIFILRHPCAVVLSRKRLGWTVDDFDLYLKQESLVNDHLKPHLNIISKAQSQIQKNACIWCIQNLIPLKTMNPEDWLITTYEDLVVNRNKEIKKILDYINYEKDFLVRRTKNLASYKANGESAVIKKTNPLTGWQKQLTEDEQNEIFEIVDHFSLDSLYGRGIMPKKSFNLKL